MTPSFRGVSARKFAEKLRESSRSFSAESRGEKKMVCASLREISRSFLRESSRLRIFVRGVNAKKELFSWADLYIDINCTITKTITKQWLTVHVIFYFIVFWVINIGHEKKKKQKKKKNIVHLNISLSIFVCLLILIFILFHSIFSCIS